MSRDHVTLLDVLRFWLPFLFDRQLVLAARLKRAHSRHRRLALQMRLLEARTVGMNAELACLKGDN